MIQKRASLHEQAVKRVARDNLTFRARKSTERRTSGVRRKRVHPAYVMAYALGIDRSRIQITAEPPLWGCVIHNDGSWKGRV